MDNADPPKTDTRPLRAALGGFATGVCVVTAIGPKGPMGITVNSFTSVSLDPPTILWSLGRASDRWPTFSQAEHFAVHVLDADSLSACQRFAWGDPALTQHEFGSGLAGVPLIEGWVSRFQCSTVRRVEAGDHMLIFGQVEQFEAREGEALVFYKGGYGPISRTTI